ncbi:UNVERIFIED_CONTAM: hypothetical protein DES50_108197 [Williamsia faeni]
MSTVSTVIIDPSRARSSESDGSVEYRQTGKLLPAFKVRIRDVVGFSVRKATRDDKNRLKASRLQEVLTVQGSGTTLAEVAVNYGTA